MGCKQSKEGEYVLDRDRGVIKQNATSPMSVTSMGSMKSLPSAIKNIKNPGKRLIALLEIAAEYEQPYVWGHVIKICTSNPAAAKAIHEQTSETPLLLACKAIQFSSVTNNDVQYTPVDAIRMLLRCDADKVSYPDSQGNIPLHYAIRPIQVNVVNNFTALSHQAEIIDILISADYEASHEYLSRKDVLYNKRDGACTPLYHTIATLPDDFCTASMAPTVKLISSLHLANPNMVNQKNASNHDKPLSILYRRFSRQFDQAEKFFPGDNSRKEVTDHRQTYKAAAMNTWKVILTLLESTPGEGKIKHPNRLLHSAVQVDCPSDLLRYIIETRPGEVQTPDEKGQLPLHIAAAMKSNENFFSNHYKFVIDELLYAYADGAAQHDKNGKLPLQLAIESGKSWIGGGVKSLYDVFPDALQQVELGEYPEIQKALNFSKSFMEEQGTGDDFPLQNGAVKEEHYEVIMMIQSPKSDLGEICSAMWANEEDGGVQMLGCIAISDKAKKCTSNPDQLFAVALSGVSAVVNAMKNHPNEPAVQEKACVALQYLAMADQYHEVNFSASGAISAIVAAMQAHVSDGIVQKEACAALTNIVNHGGSDRATVIASVSGFTALQNALGAHPNDVKVQEEACRALEALTEFEEANLPVLPSSQLGPLLENAKKNYPSECRRAADSVLLKLR